MKLKRIFVKRSDSKLWAVCYPEDKQNGKDIDVFRKLMNDWDDTQFLFNYFIKHKEELNDPFWEGISIDEAIDLVLDQRTALETELYAIETGKEGYEDIKLSDIFQPLHTNVFSLNFKYEKFRKAKPNFNKPIIRLYGIELDDDTIIITGGAIKLTRVMEGDIFKEEMEKLKRLKTYLDDEKITDRLGLES